MLLLDEEAFKKLSEEKQVLVLLQWLQKLPQSIRNTSKASPHREINHLRLDSHPTHTDPRFLGGVEAKSEAAGGSAAAAVAGLAGSSPPHLPRAGLRGSLLSGRHLLPPRDPREML